MIRNLSELKPYKSFLLGRIKDDVSPARGVVDGMLDELSEVLSLEEGESRQSISRGKEAKAGELFAGYLHYSEKQQATWTLNRNVVDETNHLILVCRYNRHIAIYISDTGWRSAIVKRLAALDKIGANYQRQVVIVQPRLTRARTRLARSKPKSPDAARLRQLDTLLLTQANACHGLQARLVVVCADDAGAGS